MRYLLAPTYSTPHDFFESLRLGVEYMLGEAGARLWRPHDDRRAALALERPGIRAQAVRDFVEYVAGREGVCFMRRVDIAQYWLEHYGDLPVMG